ncbi:MAG: peptidoglycan-binding domain-containing protein [Deltaproteobacteria bacterium]|nr:peptidoglycan-binding domain-containing protein [Deltaproteobacteria bacterium]
MKTMIARTLASLAIVLSLAVPPTLAQERNTEAAVREVGEFIGAHGSTKYECGSITYDAQVSSTKLNLIYTNHYDERCDRYCRRGCIEKIKYEIDLGHFMGNDCFMWSAYYPINESECTDMYCTVHVPGETRETVLESTWLEHLIGKSEADCAASLDFFGSNRHQIAKVLYDKLYYLRTIQQSPTPQIQEVPSTVQEAHSTQQDAPDDPAAQSQNPEMQREVRKLVQRGLASLGFDPGPADGLFGPKTRAAIRGWQAANELDATGHLTMPEAEALAAVGAEASKAQEEAPSTGCSVANHESALLDFTDPMLDLTDTTADAEDAYAQLVENADPGLGHRTEVMVDDLERLIDDLFAAGSKLDRNNLDHLRGLERAEREVLDLCIDDHYRAGRVASSCADELREYRRVIRSLTILAEDMIFVIGNAESAGSDITINASTLWPTSEVKTQVRGEDLDTMDRLLREAKDIRRQLEGKVRAERHPRRALYSCIRQTPNYY